MDMNQLFGEPCTGPDDPNHGEHCKEHPMVEIVQGALAKGPLCQVMPLNFSSLAAYMQATLEENDGDVGVTTEKLLKEATFVLTQMTALMGNPLLVLALFSSAMSAFGIASELILGSEETILDQARDYVDSTGGTPEEERAAHDQLTAVMYAMLRGNEAIKFHPAAVEKYEAILTEVGLNDEPTISAEQANELRKLVEGNEE